MNYLLYIAYLVCTTGGITFMKLGGDSLAIEVKNKLGISMGYKTFIGFVLYIISFILWQRIISQSNISIVVPILTGIVQIIVMIIGIFLLKENISTLSIIGAIIIIVGIVLIALGNRI